MIINSELLKEAIADAKAVRVTAYANAKASLQERFDKRFEAVFAEKLRNEAQEEDEESLQEVEAPNQVSGTGGEAKGPKTKAVSKGNPKKVSDANTNWKVVRMGQGPTDVPSANNKIDETTEDDGSKPEEWGTDENFNPSKGTKKMSTGGNDKFKSMGHNKPTGRYAEDFEPMGGNKPTGKYAEEAKMEESGFSSEDLDEIIKELENEVAGEEEGQQVQEPFLPPSSVNPGEEVPSSPEDAAGEADALAGDADAEAGEAGADADVANAEAGEADAEAGEADAVANMPGADSGEDAEADVADADALDADAAAGEADAEAGEADADALGADAAAGEADAEADMAGPVPPQFNQKGIPSPQRPPVPGAEGQEEISLEELLAALNEEAKDDEEEDDKKMDEISNNGIPKNVAGQDKTGGTNVYPKAPQDASRRVVKGKNHNIQGRGNIGSGSDLGKPMREVIKYQTALKESYQTIEFLRGQINEVNLLNAKLLYTNKLFKEFATVIDEPYRMKIVEAFDLTKSVREVKLAYALLAESLNFGSKRVIPNRLAQKVDYTKRAIVKQITEGYASKPVASTKPPISRDLIIESAQVARFQKLAGIKVAAKK
jgi:hypothetical protein